MREPFVNTLDIDLQLFAEGDDNGMTDLLNDLTNASTPTPDPTPTPNPESTPPQDPPATPPADPPATPPTDDKAGHAFAQMRLQLKQAQEELDAFKREKAEAELKRQTGDMVKNNQIPEDIANQFVKNQQLVSQLLEEKTERDAIAGLTNVGQKYQLDQTAIQEFVQQFYAEGINPFKTQGLDFEVEFIKRNFDKITQLKVDAAIKAEQERAALAARGATPPGASNPSGPSTPGKIESIQQLDNLLGNFKI